MFEIERYFGTFRLSKEEEVDIAIDCFEEFVMDWYHWECRTPFYSWRELKSTLFDRFNYAKNEIYYDRLPTGYRERYVEYYMSKLERGLNAAEELFRRINEELKANQ